MKNETTYRANGYWLMTLPGFAGAIGLIASGFMQGDNSNVIFGIIIAIISLLIGVAGSLSSIRIRTDGVLETRGLGGLLRSSVSLTNLKSVQFEPGDVLVKAMLRFRLLDQHGNRATITISGGKRRQRELLMIIGSAAQKAGASIDPRFQQLFDTYSVQ